MGENKVASFGKLVAGEAGFVHRLVGKLKRIEKLSKQLRSRISP